MTRGAGVKHREALRMRLKGVNGGAGTVATHHCPVIAAIGPHIEYDRELGGDLALEEGSDERFLSARSEVLPLKAAESSDRTAVQQRVEPRKSSARKDPAVELCPVHRANNTVDSLLLRSPAAIGTCRSRRACNGR